MLNQPCLIAPESEPRTVMIIPITLQTSIAGIIVFCACESFIFLVTHGTIPSATELSPENRVSIEINGSDPTPNKLITNAGASNAVIPHPHETIATVIKKVFNFIIVVFDFQFSLEKNHLESLYSKAII